MHILEQVDKQIQLVSLHILAADFCGYDPYDILDRLASLPESFSSRVQRKAATIANRVAPLPARLVLGIRPQINPKALGLCLRSFALLHEQGTDKGRWYAAAERALDLLAQTRSKDYPMGVWGYPFDWRSRILIPRGTPSAVVNSIIADGLMEWYRVTGESRFLEIARGICSFFLLHLNQSRGPCGSVCFSYTPLDNFHVHNANLFVAETLVKVGCVVERPDWIETGQRAYRYALADQRKDGSLSYWASDQMEGLNPQIDHCHSGFEIRSMYRLARLLADPGLLSAARRYYDFYQDRLLASEEGYVVPKCTPDSIFPIDIHNCAEFMILNSELAEAEGFPRSLNTLRRGTKWILGNMLDNQGRFYARIEDCRFFRLRVKISYMRWGLAWMLLALVLCRRYLVP